MIKRLITISLLLLLANAASAQSEIVRKGIALLSARDFNGANLYMDSILAKNPNEVDAIMMKGNIILNKHITELDVPPPVSLLDESVLLDDAPGVKNPALIPNKKVIDSVEVLWRKCLSLDPSRTDLNKGLCTIFAMSIQTDKLIKEISALKKALNSKRDDDVFMMLEYARALRERNRMDEASKVLAHLVSLYPNVIEVKSDWAGELHFIGDIKNAQQKALEVLAGKFDAPSRENLNDIFIFSNNIPFLLQTHKKYEQIDSNYKYAPLVEGVIRYVGDDEIWKDYLRSKVMQPHFNNDTSSLVQFCRFITSDMYSGKYIDFLSILSVPTNTIVNWAALNKAVNTFPDSMQFKLILAEFYLDGRGYTMANKYFDQVLKMKIDDNVRSDVKFIYAYSLYCNKDYKQSTAIFQEMLEDKNEYKKQAAMYFVGKMTQNKLLLKKLTEVDYKSKYGVLAQIALYNLK